MRLGSPVGLGLVAVLFAGAGPAAAHDGTELGGFLAGFSHPFLGPDHFLAMVAVGVWGAFLGRPLILALPTIFPPVMAIGGVLGMVGAPVPPIELGVAISVVLLGAMIAAAVRAPIWVACALVAAFAVFHGYAHGLELPSSAEPAGYSLGFVVATGLLHLAGIGLGVMTGRPQGAKVVRAAGAGVAGAGLYFLYVAATG